MVQFKFNVKVKKEALIHNKMFTCALYREQPDQLYKFYAVCVCVRATFIPILFDMDLEIIV